MAWILYNDNGEALSVYTTDKKLIEAIIYYTEKKYIGFGPYHTWENKTYSRKNIKATIDSVNNDIYSIMDVMNEGNIEEVGIDEIG